jgi:hypothetical protein
VWSNCTSTGPTCVATSAAAGPVTYFVAGINQFGTGGAAGIIVTWAVAGGGGGGGPPGDFCSAFAKVNQVDIAWGDTSRKKTTDYGGFPQDAVLILAFTVPSSPGSYGTPGNTSMAEYQGPPAERHLTLSSSRCDFRNVDVTGIAGPVAAGGGTTPTIDWNVGGPPIGLVPGKTYYFNYRNIGCPVGNCEASTTVNWPH